MPANWHQQTVFSEVEDDWNTSAMARVAAACEDLHARHSWKWWGPTTHCCVVWMKEISSQWLDIAYGTLKVMHITCTRTFTAVTQHLSTGVKVVECIRCISYSGSNLLLLSRRCVWLHSCGQESPQYTHWLHYTTHSSERDYSHSAQLKKKEKSIAPSIWVAGRRWWRWISVMRSTVFTITTGCDHFTHHTWKWCIIESELKSVTWARTCTTFHVGESSYMDSSSEDTSRQRTWLSKWNT